MALEEIDKPKFFGALYLPETVKLLQKEVEVEIWTEVRRKR